MTLVVLVLAGTFVGYRVGYPRPASRIRDTVRVVNTGVGGYTGRQVLEVARSMSEIGEFEGLVYLSSQNDFMEDPTRAYPEVAEEVLAEMGQLRDRFAGRVVALFVSYLEFTVRDLLRGEGWDSDAIRRTTDLYRALPGIAARHGIEYVDWLALVREATRESGSIFDRMALHVDHGHLSPRGNRLVAEAILDAL